MVKRLAAIAAMSLVAFQAVSGIALGASTHLGDGTVPLTQGAGNQCPDAPVLGVYNVSVTQDITLSVDTDANELVCDSASVSLDDVDRVVVYGKGNNAVDVRFDLEDANTGDLTDFEGLDIAVRTTGNVLVDGSNVTDDRDDFTVALEDDGFSVDAAGLDVAITYAKSYEVYGGSGDDVVDGKRVTEVGFTADGGAGADRIFGGSGDDTLDCSGSGTDQCWGGAGDDDITSDMDVVAPGAGDDDISGAVAAAVYADSKAAVTIDAGSGSVESSAGDDDFSGAVASWVGSPKADTFVGSVGDDTFKGGAGDDVAKGYTGNDYLRGGAGDDVLKGGAGNDKLRGDTGSDEAWGGNGRDACGAEVTDSCEFFQV